MAVRLTWFNYPRTAFNPLVAALYLGILIRGFHLKFKHAWLNWRKLIIDDRELSLHAKAIALYLNTYMNDSHDMAFPSIARIGGEMSIKSHSTVIKYLRELDQKGYLQRQKRFSKTTIYHATIPEEITSITSPVILHEMDHSITPRAPSVLQEIASNKQGNNQMNKQEGKTNKFVIPTHAELEEYISNQTLDVDPYSFFDYYSSINWMVGKNKMKDWKASARNWSRRQPLFSGKGGKSNGKLILPKDDTALWDFAKKHGLPEPGQLTYPQYRNRLNAEIEKRND